MKKKKLKGISPIITSVLIIAIFITVIGIAYQWGMPIIQKNMDTTTLIKAEDFLFKLDKEISDVAKFGGTEELIFNLPGEINIYPNNNTIEFSIKTRGSIYPAGGFICFSRNCNLSGGTWGNDSYSIIGVKVDEFEKYATITTYSIIYRNLTSGTKIYILDIVTPENKTITGSKNSRLFIKKMGEMRGDITKTIIGIDIR